MLRKLLLVGTAIATASVFAMSNASAAEFKGFETKIKTPMMKTVKNWETTPVFTIGETFPNGYTPAGILDGLGAYKKDEKTVRVYANHELLNFLGYSYEVCASADCKTKFTIPSGARVSHFDFSEETRKIVDSGVAIKRIYNANGVLASQLSDIFATSLQKGFSRFCSAQFVEGKQYDDERGINNSIYFTNEEDGGNFNPVGGAVWALDTKTGDFWHVPAFGRGAWENVTQVDTKTDNYVAFILADDSSPFNADNDAENEAAPLFLYVGKKQKDGDFLAKNGLRGGKLYVWVAADKSVNSPLEFRGNRNKAKGYWVEIDNSKTDNASEDGSTGFDKFGYPTQRTLWTRAEAVGAFQFSRPEDLSTNPKRGNQFVLASTGVDTFDIDPETGNGADTFGTLYTMVVKFKKNGTPKKSTLKIAYDGDADPKRGIRSPDNLDWSADGFIYVQEDEAEEDSLTGEPLFGEGAANPNEASIVRIRPNGKKLQTIAYIDRSVVLDGGLADPTAAFDTDAGKAGEWESSGILDVSQLFGKPAGTLFLYTVQAHGIEDQTTKGNPSNPESRITDTDLVEGGQLLFLKKK